MRKVALVSMVSILAGCAQEPPVRQVVVTQSDFCPVMKAALPPAGKPTWDVTDSKRTIQDARRVGAAVDARCNPIKR